MEISKIVYKVILLIMIIVMCNSCICYAANSSIDKLPDLDKIDRPVVSKGKATDIVVSILNVLTVLGVVAVVVSIAIMGFGFIMGSASEKAADQERFGGIFIAALLITGGSVVVKMLISVAEKI